MAKGVLRSSNSSNLVFLPFIAIVVVAILLTTGWVMNLYKLTQCDFEAPYKAEACRTIGVFLVPVGAIEGYITIEDGKQDE